ncbi:MAG: SDR family NAD(P)-dependent oxidoreductase [Synergistales bacterium]|nr:SDR family NAD(P)-dependent oxidoreductase [Synergistales bacterium]
MQQGNAFVTGGSGGIGEAVCTLLAEKGYNLAFTYRNNREKAETLAGALEARGVRALPCRADISRMEDVAAAVTGAAETLGGFTLLVNNAGILGENTMILDIDEAEWDAVLDVNLKGAFLVTKCALPYMLGQEGASIVNIGSIAGKNGGSLGVHYAAGKAGIMGFTFHLAGELLQQGVRANAVAPGPVDTPMLDEETRERLASLSPNGRIAAPEEIARSVLFLAENGYINGEVLDVNAGRYMD